MLHLLGGCEEGCASFLAMESGDFYFQKPYEIAYNNAYEQGRISAYEKRGQTMKFLHTSDLHIGKIVNEFSMLEDQKYILDQIWNIAVDNKVDAVVIAGDVYDRSIPPTEAVLLLDQFLTKLLHAGIKVLMISGNHDSAERVAFADRILEHQGLFIAGAGTKEGQGTSAQEHKGAGGASTEGDISYFDYTKSVVFEDEFGRVEFTLLPFLKPAVVGAKVACEAVERVLSAVPTTMDLATRRVLVTHFFVTGEDGTEPELSDSETTVQVGGLDNVPSSLFGMYDYVALGHIHKPQKIGKNHVYYAGSPLKYSFSEARGQKSVNLVTLQEKGAVQIEKVVLKPLKEMRILEGSLESLLAQGLSEKSGEKDYIQAILTDEVELMDPMSSLRSVYPNTMQIVLKKHLKEKEETFSLGLTVANQSTEQLFHSFYEMLKGEPMDEVRAQIVHQVALEAEGEK